MAKYFCTVLFYALLTQLIAQAPPSQIYMLTIDSIVVDTMYYRDLISITDDSTYHNQPCFYNDQLFYTGMSTNNKTDIFSYSISQDTTTQITDTPERSEYSPTVLKDSAMLSVVTVEEDDTTQRLWAVASKLDSNYQEEPIVLLDSITGIGYHSWLSDIKLGLFIVGPPHNLYITNIAGQETELIAENIGRCMQLTPYGELSFIHNTPANSSIIKVYNQQTNNISSIVPILFGSRDFVWLDDFTLLMAKGSSLYRFKLRIDRKWVKIADFRDQGITNITRIAKGKDNKLAFVTLKTN